MHRSNGLARLSSCWLFVGASLPYTKTNCSSGLKIEPTRWTARGTTGLCLLQSSRSKTILLDSLPEVWHEMHSKAALNTSHTSAAVTPVASVPLARLERQTRVFPQSHIDDTRTDTIDQYLLVDSIELRSLALVLARHWQFLLSGVCLVTGIAIRVQYQFYMDLSSERHFFHETSKEDGHEGQRVFAQVLDYIKIDSDGGLDKVHELLPAGNIDALRCFYAFSKLGMIFFNVYMIFNIGITVMNGSAAFYRGDHMAVPPYLKNFIEVTENRAFITVAHTFLVHLVELSSCVGLIVIVVHHFVMFYISQPSFDKFMFVHQAFDLLHSLRTFSALKCFKYVHPEIVFRYFELHMMAPLFYTGCIFRVLHAAFFVFTRLVALFLSVVAFGVKLTFISVRFNLAAKACTAKDESCEGRMARWCAVLSLLVQTAGAVSLERLMLWRLHILVAGGRDCIVDEHENVALDVYMARLAQTMWDEHFQKGNLLRYVVLMLTFDDTDFQYLILNEDEDIKHSRFSRIPTRVEAVLRSGRRRSSIRIDMRN